MNEVLQRPKTKLFSNPLDVEFMRPVDAARNAGVAWGSHTLLLAIFAFLVAFVTWASQATLEEVTHGTAKVVPSRQIQTVQSMDGGIVSEILVREGEIVDPGQVLLRIDNQLVSGDYRENHARYVRLLGAVARLSAEAEGLAEVVFPDEVRADAPQVVVDEMAQFSARRLQVTSDLDVLQQQREQKRQELLEGETNARTFRESLGLINQELDITRPLVAKGVLSEVELLRLEREATDIEGRLRATQNAIPRAEAALAEIDQRLQEREQRFRAEAWNELNQRKSELEMIKEAVTVGEGRVFRRDIRSPVRGEIKELKVYTVGGVVQPAQDLIDIVPIEDTLLVEARIRPADIAFIRPEQEATVKITAYDFAIYGGLNARVEQISADTIEDEQDEEKSYYRVRLRTDKNYLGQPEDPLPIIPGMTAAVDILTGEKTVLDYILKPLLRARANALRER